MKSNLYIYLLMAACWGLDISPTIAQPTCAASESGSLRWFYYNNIPGPYLEDLYAHPYYPQVPDGFEYISSLKAPVLYNENFGGLIRGYIVPTVSGSYNFNLTGDDYTRFYLSTDDDPANAVVTCDVPGYSGEEEHDKYPEQTATGVSLTAGNYYYFEVEYKEGAYGDHATVYWQIPGEPAVWQVIHGSYLYDYRCTTICSPRGTPCDSNPNDNDDTLDGIQDGFCNCYVEPTTSNPCVGVRDYIMALYYDNLPEYGLDDFVLAPNYPNAPDRSESLSNFVNYSENSDYENYGTRVQGFFSVPVTGTYRFNVVADDEAAFYLSTDDDPNNIPATPTASVPGYTGEFEHDKHPEQTSVDITLEKGQYYYYEFLHFEGCCGDHFGLFWQTPFSFNNTGWVRVTPFYLHHYDCTTTCIANTPCNDGNSATENDLMDANCNCTGTPCPNGDCDPGITYTPFDGCGPTDKHASTATNSWSSCNAMASPNPNRPAGHWIKYDFDELYTFQNIHIWNYNVAGSTAMGFENVTIDYSTDGNTWTQAWSGTWAQASGQNDYAGFDIGSLSEFTAQHVLITGMDNFENSGCMGFSEATFTVESAALPLELLHFDAQGREKDIAVDWEVLKEIDLAGYAVERSEDKRSFRPITWQVSEGQERNSYQYLDKEVQFNQWYYYRLKMVHLDGKVAYSDVKAARIKSKGTLAVHPNPTKGAISITMTTSQPENVILEVLRTNGQLIKSYSLNLVEGSNQHNIDLGDLPVGTYWVKVKGDVMNRTERVVVIK